MSDLDRIPVHLRAEAAELVPFARAVDKAVAELCERYDRLDAEWNTGAHPSLGDAAGDLDWGLVEAAGLDEVGVLIAAIRMRATVAHGDDPYQHRLERYGVQGWGLDRYIDNGTKLLRTLDYMERCGVLVRTGKSGEQS